MKKLMILFVWVVLIFVLPVVVFAGSKKELKSNYRVEIKIIYNKVTAEQAKFLTQKIINEHDKACEVKIETKMVGDDLGDLSVWNGSGSLDNNLGVACLDGFGNIIECPK
jgi:hypothetical protein